MIAPGQVLQSAPLVLEQPAPGRGWAPGPLVRRLLALLVASVLLSGALVLWLVARTAGEEAMERLARQQNDEVELVARLLSSKIEQSQKVLAGVAGSISPLQLESSAALEWLLRQGLPAVGFFDAIQVVRQDGQFSVNLRNGRLEPASELEPGERESLRRTLLEGKPMVSGVIGSTLADARVMFTMPLLRGDGLVAGALAGVLRLQSQGMLPHSLALPARSESRFIVFTRDGVILAHPRLERVLGSVADEPGLADVWTRCCAQGQALANASVTEQQEGLVVSLASVPMPQWVVARVSQAQALLEPLQGAQRRAWGVAGWAMAGTVVLSSLVLLWLLRPLTLLRQRAHALAQGEASAEALFAEGDWPRSEGEVKDVVQMCLRLLEQRREQQSGSVALLQQLQAVLGHAPLGIAVTRCEHVEVVSQQAGRLLGYATQELQGRDLLELLAAPDGAARVRAAFAAHGSFDGELPLVHRDGSTLWMHVQGQPVDRDEPERGTVWVLEDCTTLRAERQQEEWARWHDPLTYLPNRAACERRLQLLLSERAERASHARRGLSGELERGVLLYLDVDHFTVINDAAGHHAGDDVLRHLARLLQAQVRQSGWVARLGGDEFAVVLPACTRARGSAMAQQLCDAVRAWEPVYHGRSFTLGLSVGLVPLEGVSDVVALLHAADMACYEAKRAGRGRLASGPVKAQSLEGVQA